MINGGPINGAAINALYAPIVWIPYAVPKPHIVSRRYSAVLTNGTTSVAIPISSINARIVSAAVSTITVVVPAAAAYAAEILDYADDDIQITATEIYSDGSSASVNWPVYHLDTIRSDQGSRSYSTTLTATRTQTYAQTRKFNLVGISYISTLANGGTIIRCELNKDFNPNDIAILPNGTELTIATVVHMITSTSRLMELRT